MWRATQAEMAGDSRVCAVRCLATADCRDVRFTTLRAHNSTSPPASYLLVPVFSASAGSLADDDEYRSQLKSIFLHLLDRLVQVMEHESESASKLAALRFGPDAAYIDLFGASDIDAFLRSSFDLADVPRASSRSSRSERENAFTQLVKTAQLQLDSRPAGVAPQPSRDEFTAAIKQVCASTQAELNSSASTLASQGGSVPRASEVAKSLAFFVRTFDFTRGDIAHDAQLLERNVEEIISAGSQ